MRPSPKALALPLLLIAIGVAWLLTSRQIIPGVNWVWVAMLGLTGVLTIVLGGLDKVTAFIGSFLIVCSVASVMRQSGMLSADDEVPILVIIAGLLLGAVMLAPIRSPSWFQPPAN